MRAAVFRFIPLIVWAALIAWLSLDADPPRVDLPMMSWDKLQHAAAYALLTLLAGVALQGGRRRRSSAWLLAFVFSLGFGAFLEVAQGVLTEVRSPEWGDLLADFAGAALVLAAGWWWGRRTPPPGGRT